MTRGAAAVILLLAAIVVVLGCGAAESGARGRSAPTVEPVSAFRMPVATTVRSGDTIESVSRRLAGPDWVAWRDAISGEIEPRRLRPGLRFEGALGPTDRLERLSVELDLKTRLEMSRRDGGVTCRRVERDVEERVVRVEGVVDASLFGAVADAGEEPELAVRLARIFQWDIDFFRDLRRGDTFVVLVQRSTVEGAFYRYGPVFAAQFTNQGRRLEAYLFRAADDRPGYYDREGRPVKKQFLKAPLRFSRVTSGFSYNRLHPVLGQRMPHYGVDYGAPVGTPVRVTADGVVRFVGAKGGGGRMVSVRHPNAYETNYLHLSGYGRGIRRGVRVRQGQVIGYVGTTGWATGPHLDYRIRHQGRWINPLRLTSPPAKPLAPEALERFLSYALSVSELLAGREPPVGACC